MAKHIMDLCEEKARAGDGQFAIAYALMEVARAANASAGALKSLGVGNAATDMGALELLAVEVKDGTERLAEAIRTLDFGHSD